MTNSKFKRVLSLVLAFVMTASLFSNWPMPVFATDGVSSKDLAPVVSAKLANEVTLYDGVNTDAKSVDVTCPVEISVELYKQLTVEESGKVFYQFYITDEVSDDLADIFNKYMFIGAEDVALPTDAVMPVEGEEQEETVDVELPIDGSDVKITLTVPVSLKDAITVQSEKVTTPPTGTEDALIWGNSLFYKIDIKANGEPYIPEDGFNVSYLNTLIPAAENVYAYNIYTENGENVITSSSMLDAVTAAYYHLPIIGVAAYPDIILEEETSLVVKPKTDAGSINVYYDIDLTDKETYPVSADDTFEVTCKLTLKSGETTTDVYVVSSSSNSTINDNIVPDITYIRCSDVEEYVEPSPSPDTTPTPTPDTPDLDDLVLSDEETGIVVSGQMPDGTTLDIKELTIDEIKIDTELYPLGEYTKAYDIKLMLDGSEYTPEEPVTLELTKDNIGFADNTAYMVYHVHGDDTENVSVIGPIKTGEGLTLTVEEFSQFIFANIYKKAGTSSWKGTFNKSVVTVYSSLMPDAPSLMLSNAEGYAVTTTAYYEDYNGTVWYRMKTAIRDDDGNSYRWVKAEDLTIGQIIDTTLTDTFGTGISVAGSLPNDVNLNVQPVTDLNAVLYTEEYPVGENTVVYDISLYKGDDVENTYQPETPVQVTFPARLFEQFGTEKFYIGYHVHDDGTVDMLGLYEYTGEDIVVTLDSFSRVVLSDGISIDDISITSQKMNFYPGKVSLYRETTLTDKLEFDVTEGDSITVEKDAWLITFPNGKEVTLYVIQQYSYQGSNAEMADAIDRMNNYYNMVLSTDVYPETLPDVPEIVEGQFFDPTTGITVTGMLPKDGNSKVIPLTKEQIALGAEYPLGKNTVAYDISLFYKNNEYQPDGAVTVDIPHDALGFNAGKGLVIYHIHGTGDEQTTSIIGPINYGGEGLELTVEGFSQFIFTDLFEEASGNGWAGVISKKHPTLYSDIITKSASITPENDMLNNIVRGNAHYVDADGTVWLRIQNGAVYDENDVSYRWIKREDVYLTKFDGQRITPAVNYTQVAPLATAETAVVPAAANYTTFNARALTRGIAPQAEVSDGLYINKSIVTSDPTTGTATIKIEAYVTGEVETKTTVLPTDVVVILDLSYSMTTDMAEIEYVPVSGQAETIYRTYGDTIYIRVDGKRYPVTITPTGTIIKDYVNIDEDTSNSELEVLQDTQSIYYKDGTNYYEVTIDKRGTTRNFYYTYTDNNGTPHTIESVSRSSPPDFIDKLYVLDLKASSFIFSYTPDGTTTPVSETIAATANIPENKYLRPQIVGEISRFEALQNAVKQFADDIHTLSLGETDSADDNIANTLAIVTYSGEGNANDGDLNPTGLYYNNSGTIAYESLVTSSDTRFETIENYGNALLDMTNNAIAGQITTIIDDWETGNGTRTDLGTEMALGIISAQPNSRYVDAAGNVIRNKVVVLFTDGEPESGVENDIVADAWQLKNTYNTTVYTIAVTEGADAEITVSADGSTGTINTSGINDLMHYVSNNFKNATSMSSPGNPTFIKEKDSASGEYVISGDSYYLTAEDSESLNEIFSKISTAIDASAKVQLDSTAQLKDIISPYFTLTEGGKIENVILEEYDAVYTNGVLGWETQETATRIPSTADNVELIDKDDDGVNETINVVGFDYAANFVSPVPRKRTESSETADFYGSKLVITLPVIASEYFFGGNCAITNGSESGIYRPKKDENGEILKGEDGKPIYEPVKPFDVPDANVNIIDIDIEWDDQHIYRTNSANLDTLFRKARVKNRYSDERKTLEEVLDGVNNDYVNMKFTVTEKGTNKVIGTFTVNAGQTVNQGTWDTTDNLYPVLEKDTDYLLTWVIEPSIDLPEGQTVPTINHDDPVEATVYVYNPVLTFKDDNAFYGETVPTAAELAANKVGEVVWVNASQGYAEYGSNKVYKDVVNGNQTEKTDTGNTMLAPEPQLVIDCSPVSGVTDGVITTTSDIPVNVTVTKDVQGGDDVDITDIVEFKHQNCNDAQTETLPSGAEFVIHVNTVSLDISKKVTGANDTSGEFIVNVVFAGNDFDENLTIKVDNVNTAFNVVGGAATLQLKLKHGQTVELTGLPVGTYTATETVDGSRYDTTANGNQGVTASVILSSTTTKDTIAFVNNLKAGYLEITKVIDMPDGFVASTTDEFTIQVKQGETVVAEVSLKNGQTSAPIQLVQGTYQVVENVKGDLYGDHTSQDHAVTINAGETTKTTVTNPAKKGNLEIAKTVVDEAVNYDSTRDTFTVKVKVDGYTAKTLPYTIDGIEQTPATVGADGYATIVLGNNQTALIKDMLMGADYEVIEILTTAQQQAYSEPVLTNAVSEIVADDTQHVTVTNTVKAGYLTIDKAFELPDGIKVADDEKFNFTVTGPNGYSKNVVITKDGQLTLENTGKLFIGEYTVEENLDADQQKIYTPKYSTVGGKATVTDGGTATVTVTNTVTAGKLDVTKQVKDVADNIKPTDKYTMEITLTGDIVIEKLIGTVAGESVEKPVVNGKATIELANGETAQFTNIPVGVSYTVTETGVDTDYFKVSYENRDGAITTNTPLVKVINTRKYGKLTITKDIVNREAEKGETFVFTVTGPNSFSQEVVIEGEGSVTITHLPLGNYTVTEDQSWAYKFTLHSMTGSANITEDADGNVIVKNSAKPEQWLKADAYAENKFAAFGETGNVTEIGADNVIINGTNQQ